MGRGFAADDVGVRSVVAGVVVDVSVIPPRVADTGRVVDSNGVALVEDAPLVVAPPSVIRVAWGGVVLRELLDIGLVADSGRVEGVGLLADTGRDAAGVDVPACCKLEMGCGAVFDALLGVVRV